MSGHSPTARSRAARARKKPQAHNGEGKRERILDAAVKVFAAKGFYDAKVSQIAAAAGVADGTIYLYFKSKDELLISLFEDRMDMVLATLREALAASGGALSKLRRVIELHLELIEKNPEMGEVITVELRQSSKFIRDYDNPKFAEFLRLIAGAVAEGQQRGELRPDVDPALTARALFGALDEISLAWIVRAPRAGSSSPREAAPRCTASPFGRKEGQRGDLRHAAQQLATLFLDGLRAPLRAGEDSQ